MVLVVLVVLGVLGRWRGETHSFGQIGTQVSNGGNNELLMTTLLPSLVGVIFWGMYCTVFKFLTPNIEVIMWSLIAHYYLHYWLGSRFSRKGGFPSLHPPKPPKPYFKTTILATVFQNNSLKEKASKRKHLKELFKDFVQRFVAKIPSKDYV